MPTRISKARFDEFTFGFRGSGEQDSWNAVAYWSTHDTDALGALFYVEKADSYLGVLCLRNNQQRFLPHGPLLPFRTLREGEASICQKLKEIEDRDTELICPDGDGKPGVDLFATDHDGTLNSVFVNIRDTLHSQAARQQLQEIARWFIDGDGNFVRDFQTAGTDARLWELYLFRVFHSLDMKVDQSIAIPDFALELHGQKAFVEAVTANAGNNKVVDLMAGPTPRPDDFWKFVENDMPIIFGSPLYSKMKKRYWEKDAVRGHPFAIAIADFHAPGSMIWSHTALSIYLFGTSVERVLGPDGQAVAIPKPLQTHTRGEKTIPSNFFAQPGTENVSAVIFSNAGTKAKFSRMGTLAGFGDPTVAVRRVGTLSNPEPGALEGIPFDVNIENGEYLEGWADELEIYHNPNALFPWPDEGLIPAATHFRQEGDDLVWRGAPFRVLNSFTQVKSKPPFPTMDKT